MPETLPIYRITVDEFLAEDLVRVIFAELKIPKNTPCFDDDTGSWTSEEAFVLNPETWAEKLALPAIRIKDFPLANLFEGQVFLCGNVSLNRSKGIKKKFKLNKTPARKLLPVVSKMINLLSCSVIKVAHHGSMHSSPLDVYEKLKPETAVISCSQEVSTKTAGNRILSRNLFPHRSAEIALEEVGSQIVTTDGSYETDNQTGDTHPGSVVIVVPPGGKPWTHKLKDDANSVPVPPQRA